MTAKVVGSGARVKPDRNVPERPWSVPAWLMLASAMWSAIVLWQLVTVGDEPGISSDGSSPTLLIMAAAASLVASSTAFWTLRNGSKKRVRGMLMVVAVCGSFAIFSTVVALVTLVLMRRRQRAAGAPAPARGLGRRG